MVVDDEHDKNSIFTIGLEDAGFEVDACLTASTFSDSQAICFSKDIVKVIPSFSVLSVLVLLTILIYLIIFLYVFSL